MASMEELQGQGRASLARVRAQQQTQALQQIAQQPVTYLTAGDNMAQQQAGIENFFEGVRADHEYKDRLFAADMAAIAVTVGAVSIWQRHRAAKAARLALRQAPDIEQIPPPDRAGHY